MLNGFVAAKTARTLTLQTMAERVTMENAEIVGLQESAMSIMPEGLLETLNETQVRDLVAYLMSGSQVPLPEEGK